MTLVIHPPQTLDDFPLMPQSQQKLKMILNGQIAFPGQKKSILLYGVYGTGKTTMAKLLPGWIETSKTTTGWQNQPVEKLMDTTNPNYEIHPCASGQNGVSLINRIQTQTSYMSFNTSNLHYVILDEFDLLTDLAIASFKAIMNREDIVYILTTNHLNKVDRGVQDRSILIDMNAPPPTAWVAKLRKIYSDSGVIAPPDHALEGIVTAGNGSARNILTDIQIVEAGRLETLPNG